MLEPLNSSDASEIILVVEDEQPVRHVVITMLTRFGYRVLAAQDSAEAAEIALRFAGRIDLLLTDVVMPGVNGPSLAERLVKERQELRILFMSGRAPAAMGPHRDVIANAGFLEKPFTQGELILKVRETLAAPPTADLMAARRPRIPLPQ